jgi:hypothetical protein
MKPIAWSIFLSCHGFAALALGQEPPPVTPLVESVPEPEPPVVHDLTAPAKTDITIDRQTLFRAGIGFSGPIGGTASLQLLHGLSADIADDGTRVEAVCAIPMPHCAQGYVLRADVGTGGGKVSLGLGALAKVHEEDFKGTVGAALRLALAHTWGDPIGQPAGLTFVGPELDLSVKRIDLTVGVLFRVGGDGGSSAVFSWGLGVGL